MAGRLRSDRGGASDKDEKGEAGATWRHRAADYPRDACLAKGGESAHPRRRE